MDSKMAMTLSSSQGDNNNVDEAGVFFQLNYFPACYAPHTWPVSRKLCVERDLKDGTIANFFSRCRFFQCGEVRMFFPFPYHLVVIIGLTKKKLTLITNLRGRLVIGCEFYLSDVPLSYSWNQTQLERERQRERERETERDKERERERETERDRKSPRR